MTWAMAVVTIVCCQNVNYINHRQGPLTLCRYSSIDN